MNEFITVRGKERGRERGIKNKQEGIAEGIKVPKKGDMGIGEGRLTSDKRRPIASVMIGRGRGYRCICRFGGRKIWE